MEKKRTHIEDDSELYDFSYATEETEWYTHIANDGNTNLNGLWVKLPEIIQEKRQLLIYFCIA